MDRAAVPPSEGIAAMQSINVEVARVVGTAHA